MRTALLTVILIPLIAAALVHPWIGALTWTWVSLMSPHRLTFGFTYGAPVAMLVAIATLIGVVVTRDRRKLTMMPVTWCLLAFVAWMCVTSLTAVHPSLIGEMFSKVMKIQFMIFVTLLVLHGKRHIDLFVWVVVISLGFYGVKGGIYTVLGGGVGRVWGPPGSFIAGNNELALALTMTVPLMNHLRVTATHRLVRWGMLAAMVLTAFSILGSQSRGAFLAIMAMGLYLWRYSGHRFGFALLLIPFALGLIAFMPDAWMERMRTILEYEKDTSATGRINSWIMAYNLAMARPTGGGFEVITPYLFSLYAPNPASVKAAHSIYFQVLGEHGFIGLALFLGVWILTWRTGTVIRRKVAGVPDLAWAGSLAAMVHVSLVGYAVGGAFLSLAYFDLPYNMMIIVVMLKLYVDERLAAPRDATTPTPAAAPKLASGTVASRLERFRGSP
jgi:probable O-glycosylation ligase (exosortase A-associated)